MPHPAPVYGQGLFAAHLTKHKLFAILAARLIKTKNHKNQSPQNRNHKNKNHKQEKD